MKKASASDEPKKRVYGYVRVSSDGQKDNTSIPVQIERINAFCISQDWDLLEIFEDSALSGSNTERPAYQEMLSKLKDADLILTFKLDRLSRNLKDILILVEDHLEPFSVGLKSVTEPFDTSTPEGKLMLQMLGGFAEFERKRISERVMSGKMKKAQVGGFCGSPIPYGYIRTPDGPSDFELNPDEARIVKKLFSLYSKGNVGVAKLKTLTGCSLSPQGITKLLSNPFYTGKIRYTEFVQENDHEPLVSERMFRVVQKVKNARSNNINT